MKCEKIILASASPRRRDLLEQIGVVFETEKAVGEETFQGSTPKETVCTLAAEKAAEVADRHREEETVLYIGADTVVAADSVILGKPKDGQEAEQMLKTLSGREHSVYTGVCLILKEQGKEVRRKTFCEETKVKVHQMSEEQIQEYIASGEPFDKAGSYGIQGRFAIYIKGIEGDYNNVVGLPIAALYQEALEWGIEIRRN